MEAKNLKIYQLINLAIIGLGIQFTNSVQMTNMSSVYKLLGASSSLVPIFSLAGPVCGLLVQPIVGQFSDNTFSKYGKRHPYIFWWTIVAAISCIGLALTNQLWLAIVYMWMLSSSTNGSTEAVRALTGDVVNNKQKARAFSWQAILAGVGAGLATTLPSVIAYFYPSKNGMAGNAVPFSLKITFAVSGVLLLITMYWTCKTIKEKIPSHRELLLKQKQQRKQSFYSDVVKNFKKLFKNVLSTPLVIKQFGLVQLFTWIGIFTIWLYFSLALSQHLYGLAPGADIIGNSKNAAIFEKAVLQTNFYFSIYQYCSVAYALIIPVITEKFSEKIVHGVSLIVGALSLLLLTFTTQPALLVLCMVFFGIMWGSIVILPYTIIAESIPSKKMGVYFGLFNISITMPQILAAIFLQPVFVYLLRENAINMLRISAVSIFIAGAILVYWFFFKDKIKARA